MRMLREKFADADAILERLGQISRGPRKGQPRGILVWTKTVEGGWDYRAGRVRTRGTDDWKVLRGDGSESCIAQQIHRERMNAQADAERVARAERAQAEAAMSPFEREVYYALRARKCAIENLREGSVWGMDEFHDRMQRAIRGIQRARAIRNDGSEA